MTNGTGRARELASALRRLPRPLVVLSATLVLVAVLLAVSLDALAAHTVLPPATSRTTRLSWSSMVALVTVPEPSSDTARSRLTSCPGV